MLVEEAKGQGDIALAVVETGALKEGTLVMPVAWLVHSFGIHRSTLSCAETSQMKEILHR